MAQATHPRSYAGIEENITELEQQWAAAAKANDSQKIAALLSEVFIELDSDGKLYDKSQVLDRTKADKWQVNEISDVKVMVHGNMAIATGVWQGKGTLAGGKMVDEHERWLDTWLKNGKWQCVASASTAVKA
jgi:ketosteroid isomerase-like protein